MKLGKYSLTLSYGEDQKVFNDILYILEMTTQNKSEGYRYTESYVSSGGDATHPITGMLGISNCKNGKAVRKLCGGGLDRILSHPDEHFYKLPTLVYNDKIGISTPDNTEVGGFYVHILGEEREQYTFETVEELSTLPNGEYLIQYFESIYSETIVKDGDEYYSREDNDCMFRLVIQ